MSTLETAFQLKDAAHFVVGSQSLVPFGRPSISDNDCEVKPTTRGAGVWPYDRLFSHLLNYESAVARDSLRTVVDTLGRFYDDSRHAWPNPSVPFSLLDLDTINSGSPGSFDTNSLNVLVSAIMRLMPDQKIGKKRRGAFIEKASLAVAGDNVCRTDKRHPKAELSAGSIALVDVIALCRQVLADPRLLRDERKAIKALINSKLVVACRESIYRPAGTTPPDDPEYSFKITRPDSRGTKIPRRLNQSLGFQGVSALYFPTPHRRTLWGKRDRNIFNDLDSVFYRDLTLSKDTDWVTLALEQIPQHHHRTFHH